MSPLTLARLFPAAHARRLSREGKHATRCPSSSALKQVCWGILGAPWPRRKRILGTILARLARPAPHSPTTCTPHQHVCTNGQMSPTRDMS